MSMIRLKLMCSIVLFVVTGCSVQSSIQYTSAMADEAGATYAIFNPDDVSLPPEFIGRTDWPATVAHQSTGEIVEFRESIIDQDGQTFGRRDDYRRRFYSRRTGRQIR